MKGKIFRVLITLVVVMSFSMVMAVPVAAADLEVGSGKTYTTIQAAINAANPDDTIIVDAGTYTEDLTVNIANLTIQSVDGAETTIIQLVDGVGIDIQGGASGFTLGGVVDEGFTIQSSSGAGTTFNIQLANAPSDVTISYNTIDTTGGASMGVSVGAAGATGLTISNNTFTGDDTPDGSIWGPAVVDVTVTNNVFTGLDLVSYGVQFSGIAGTSVINENTITDYKSAGAIVILSGTGVSGLTINGNPISGCANGIRFYDDSGTGDITTVTVTENTLTDNDKAIRIGDGAHIVASNFVIENNNISGSTSYGLQNEHTSQVVTAESNWWGNASGPTHATNPSGTGDVVTDRVDFVPWLDAAYPGGSAAGYPVYNSTTAEEYETIQEAIDDASAGDTIVCKDGTYTEDLTVNIADLTLKSESGMASTTIQLVDGVGIDIQGGADNFVLGGASGAGFMVKDSGSTTFNIQVTNAPPDVTISYNTIDTTVGGASMGINIGAAGASGLTISNNEFTADDGDGSIWGPDVVSVVVSGNTFTGPTSPSSGYAVEFSGASGTSTISGNEITNYANGVFIFGAAPGCGTTAVSGLTISGNTLSGCINGIRLGHSSQTLAVDVTVTGNDISGCEKGILFAPDDTHADMSGNTFADNDFDIFHAAEIMAGGSYFFGNINDAMEAADPGDTINVYPGVYVEDLYIDFSLTIQSEEGAVSGVGEWSVVTELDGDVGIELGWGSEDPLAETAVFDGFYIEEQMAPIYLYEVNNGSDLTVSNNVLGWYLFGIMSDGFTVDNASSVTIEGNYIFDGEACGIYFEEIIGGSEVTIRDNEIFQNDVGIYIEYLEEDSTLAIEDNLVADNDYGVEFYDVDDSTVTIAGNTIGEGYSELIDGTLAPNYFVGIYFGAITTVSDSTITIGGETRAEGNVIVGNGLDEGGNGGIVVQYMAGSSLEILNNDILDNYYYGVDIWGFDEYSSVDIHYNSIVGNNYGVSYDSPYTIDATCNWWGDVAGPYIYTNPHYAWTDGDPVTSDADYIPWLIQSELDEGWNIWSAPIAAGEAGWEQMQAELVEDGIESICYFDSATQLWGADPDDAGALDAFYIKVPEDSSIRYCISDEATFPGQKAMKVGWNLIGLADLHNKLSLPYALSDAYWGTGQTGLFGYNRVISPTLNGESWTYVRDDGFTLLYPTEGYWVFMVNDGTLGGFTSTPIVEEQNGP